MRGGAAIPLTKASLVVGRKPECDITIACNSVSSRHCLLEFEDGWWWIRDLESRTGTGVNGRRISNQRIAPKDILTIGRQRLVVVYQVTKKFAAITARRDAEEDLALSFLTESPQEVREGLPVDEPDELPKNVQHQAPFEDENKKSVTQTMTFSGTQTQKIDPVTRHEFSQSTLQPPAPKSSTPQSGSQRFPAENDFKPASAQSVPQPSSIPRNFPQQSPSETSPGTPSPLPQPKPTNSFGPELGKLLPSGGGAPIPLRGPELVLGRSPECDVRIRFPSVSSRHCKLMFDKGYWLVEDLNSTNGTWVDGDRCLLQCLLPESVLALDKHRYTIHYLLRADGPPPVIKRLFTQSLLEKAGFGKQFTGDQLAGRQLPDDDEQKPKRYNLLDSDDESR
ncbi:MAG: FHA domain-containing protein [Schlesneria sp.]